MKKDAFRMRKLIEERVRIRVAYAYYDKVELSGREAVIGGELFHCSAFEQVDPNAVKGSYVYALSVGDFGLPRNQLWISFMRTSGVLLLLMPPAFC